MSCQKNYDKENFGEKKKRILQNKRKMTEIKE
jgi:hypothetical protein